MMPEILRDSCDVLLAMDDGEMGDFVGSGDEGGARRFVYWFASRRYSSSTVSMLALNTA